MEHPWQYGQLPAQPSAANVQARTYLLDLMQRGLPGYPTDDRHLQSQKFAGIIYTAIRPLMRAVRKADVVCLRRVRKRRNRTTFGPGSVVAKSMSAGHGKSQRDDYVPVDADHPVARLLDRPQQRDGTETMGDVLEYATLQACLTGVSPFWCVPSAKYLSGGTWRPVQLYALPTALTQPQPAASAEYPSGWYRLLPYYATPTGGAGFFSGRTVGAIGAPLDGREVKRRLYKHPLYRWDGYSPLTACAFLLDVAEAVDQARWAQMQSGINTSLLIMASGMDKPAVDRFGQEMTQAKGGARNNRTLTVLSSPNPESKFTATTPHAGQARLDYSDDWEQVQAAVLAVFGTPRTVAGLSTATGHAELYAAKKQFFEGTVQPECEELGDFLTAAVAQPWEEEDGELFVECIPEEPKNEDSHVIPAGDRVTMNLVTVNEGRASQNLPPLPGGDLPMEVWLKKLDGIANPAPPPPPELAGKPGKGTPGDTPTGGAPPTPDNPEGEGTRPPTGPRKSMSTLVDSDGGALVPSASVVVRGRKARRLLRRPLKRV